MSNYFTSKAFRLMPKKAIAVCLLLTITAIVATPADSWNSKILTVTAGTAIRIVANSVRVNSVFFQMIHGGTGLGYVFNASPQVTCANGGAGTSQIAELTAATSTAPGASLTVPSNGAAANDQGGIDLQWFCIDGAHTGDTILVSWNPR